MGSDALERSVRDQDTGDLSSPHHARPFRRQPCGGPGGRVLLARAAATREVGDWAEEVDPDGCCPHTLAPVDERRRAGDEVGPHRRGQGKLHRRRHQKRRLLSVTQFTPTPCLHVALFAAASRAPPLSPLGIGCVFSAWGRPVPAARGPKFLPHHAGDRARRLTAEMSARGWHDRVHPAAHLPSPEDGPRAASRPLSPRRIMPGATAIAVLCWKGGHERALPVIRKGPLTWVETRGIEPRTSCLQIADDQS